MQHTRRLTHVQHMKHYLRASYYCAAHKLLLVCSTRKIARVQYKKVDSHAVHFTSHAYFDSSHDKNWRTHSSSPHASVNLDVSCTVADWSAFLELVLSTMLSHNSDNGAHRGHYIGGMGLIFNPALVRRLLGPPGLSGPITSTSWTHRHSK